MITAMVLQKLTNNRVCKVEWSIPITLPLVTSLEQALWSRVVLRCPAGWQCGVACGGDICRLFERWSAVVGGNRGHRGGEGVEGDVVDRGSGRCTAAAAWHSQDHHRVISRLAFSTSHHGCTASADAG